MPDPETFERLASLSPIASRQAEQLRENPDMQIDAETGEMVDPEAMRQQAIEEALAEQEEPIEEEAPAEDKTDVLHYTQDTPEETDYSQDPRYMRIDNLPSKFVFYDFSQVFGRAMDVDDWVNLTRAVNRKNITEFIDAFAPTLSVDIRDLALNDFIWFMYWQRLNSFPQNPLQISWMSRYGNRNQTQVSNTNLFNVDIEINRQEYLEIMAQGYRVPTVRDYEVIMSGYLTPDQTLKYNIAKYLNIDLSYENAKEETENFVADFLAAVGKTPLPTIAGLDEIKTKFEFGIRNEVELLDQHYNTAEWKASLEKGVKVLLQMEERDEQLFEFMQTRLADLKAREEAGEELQPSPETVEITFTPWNFFPDIQE